MPGEATPSTEVMQFALGLVPGVVDQASETSLAASWQGLSLDLQGLGEPSRWGASGPSHVEARCAVLGGLLASLTAGVVSPPEGCADSAGCQDGRSRVFPPRAVFLCLLQGHPKEHNVQACG